MKLLLGKTINQVVIKAGRKLLRSNDSAESIDTELVYTVGEESVFGEVKSIYLERDETTELMFIVINAEDTALYPYSDLSHIIIEGIY